MTQKNPLARMPDYPPHTLALQQSMIALFGRLGATRDYQFPRVAALAPGATSQQVPITFRVDGIVTGICASTRGGTIQELSELEAKVLIGGSEALVTDGSSAEFTPLVTWVGGARNWYPLNRRVSNGQTWTVQFQNNSAATTIIPTLKLSVIEAT